MIDSHKIDYTNELLLKLRHDHLRQLTQMVPYNFKTTICVNFVAKRRKLLIAPRAFEYVEPQAAAPLQRRVLVTTKSDL